MHSYDDIRKISYYESGNDFSGSEGLFNFKIIPKDDKLEVYVWYGTLCFKLIEEYAANDTFELTQDGLDEVHDFLEEEFDRFNDRD